jgi:hypothetical protein
MAIEWYDRNIRAEEWLEYAVDVDSLEAGLNERGKR